MFSLGSFKIPFNAISNSYPNKTKHFIAIVT